MKQHGLVVTVFATEKTMRPFSGPGSPSRGVTVAAGIINKVKGSAVHRPGMTPVDGEGAGLCDVQPAAWCWRPAG